MTRWNPLQFAEFEIAKKEKLSTKTINVIF